MDLHNWIISLHENEAQLLGAAIAAVTTLVAAFIAVRTAFRQIAKQFENKVIYEGWTDFQDKLFGFSTALTNYSTTIQWLPYFFKGPWNPLANVDTSRKDRLDKWNQVIGEYAELQKAYIKFLISYDTHEIIFISLKSMHHEFIAEYRRRVDDKQRSLMEKIFPEMYGNKNNLSEKELNKIINDYWMDTAEISAFLDDFRRELQNVTVGRILNKTIPKRVPPEDKYKILTTKGFVSHKTRWKNILKEIKKKPQMIYF
jgi:hypothetical protein